MDSPQMSEQDQASMEGPRAMKEPGSPLWCWQTISALQSLWKSLELEYDLYMKTWSEAEEYRVWEKVPYENPFGTKEAMLERLKVGDEAAARVRVAVQAMPSRTSTRRSKGANDLTARIARDRPDVWERMKNGEFSSVAAAAREAGINVRSPKRVAIGEDKGRVINALKRIYGPEGFKEFAELATRLASEDETETPEDS